MNLRKSNWAGLGLACKIKKKWKAMLPPASSPEPLPSQQIEKESFVDGARAVVPTMPGVFAWGLVTGMAMINIGMTLPQALGMSFLVYAGSAQLAALPLIAAGVPISVVFFTAVLVNLRFVIFSAAIAPHFTHLSLPKRLWVGYLNADVTMAIFPVRFPSTTLGQTRGKLGYFTGICYPNWTCWQVGSVLGMLLAGQIPEHWDIGFVGTLALLAITIPLTFNIPALVGVIVAAVTAVLAASLPYRLGLLIAVILGMTAALLAESLRQPEGGKA